VTEEGAAFIGETTGQPQPWRAVYSGIEYPGEVVSAREWRPEWSRPLRDEHFFRVVFLAAPTPPRELHLEDPRIAVCLPRRAVDWEQAPGARELRSLREARGRYLTQPGGESAQMRDALARHEQALRRRAIREAVEQFAAGRMVMAGGQIDDVGAVARDREPDEWVSAIAQLLLAQAYPKPVVAGGALPGPLTEEVVAYLFDGLFNPRPSPQGWAAVRQYGSALGLTPPAFEGCRMVAAVGRAVEEAGGSIEAGALFSRLAYEHGMPRSLSALSLMAFLARNRPSVELTLRPDHRLQTREGRPFPGDRITWDLLGEVALHPNTTLSFNTVRLGQPPSLRTVAPYAKEVAPDLEVWEEQDIEQPGRFAEALRRLHLEVSGWRRALTRLSRDLAQTLPSEVEEDMATLETVTEAGDAAAFYHASVRGFASPSRLRKALERARAARPLAEGAEEALAVKRYLDAMPTEGLTGEIATARSAMLAQFDLAALVRGPSAWPSLNLQARRLCDRYVALYRDHHAQYHRQAAMLKERLARARLLLQALERLNGLQALGPPVAPGLNAEADRVDGVVRPCTTPQPPMEEHPVCPECRITLADSPPTTEAERVVGVVQGGLEEQLSRLSALVIGKVLEQPDTEPVDRFLRVVRAADLEALPLALDDRVMAFLRALLDRP
jgi:hypothetical protein